MSLPETPQSGQPFNFNHLLDCVLVPRVVANDRRLRPGARLLWGVIRQRSWRDGRCTSSDEQLSEELGVKPWSVRFYCRQLHQAGLLRTTPRPGQTPIRELLWHVRFHGRIQPKPFTRELYTSEPRRRQVALAGELPAVAIPKAALRNGKAPGAALRSAKSILRDLSI